jgi:hypothetical protein
MLSFIVSLASTGSSSIHFCVALLSHIATLWPWFFYVLLILSFDALYVMLL